MNVTKDDKHLRNYELKQGLSTTARQNNKFYRLAKDKWQCTHCLKEYSERVSTCSCGNQSVHYIIPRKYNYFEQYFFEVYRMKKETLIKLTYCSTIQKQGKVLNQKIDLVRKVVFGNELDWLNSTGLQYSQSMGYERMSYWVNGKWGIPNKWEKGPLTTSKVNFWFKEANPQVFNNYEKFSFLNEGYIKLEKFQKIMKYNKELKFLNSKLPGIYFINDIEYVVKYPKTFKKYSKYFERYGKFDGKTLQRLSWYKEMILYSEFEKMIKFSGSMFRKKDINSYDRLKKHLKLMDMKKYSFDNYSYNDYLRLLTNFGYVMTDEYRFNKRWVELHDELVDRVKYKREVEKEQKFKEKMDRYQKYEEDGIYIVPPQEIKDLFVESSELRHCVKTYVDRIIRDETVVLFVRTNPEEPFITAEVRNNKIVQMRGKHNSTEIIKEKHREVLRKYIKNYREEEVTA